MPFFRKTLNPQYVQNYNDAQDKLTPYLTRLAEKVKQLPEDQADQKKLVQSVTASINHMKTKLEGFSWDSENRNDKWYLAATRVLNQVYDGMAKPGSVQPQDFLKAVQSLRSKTRCSDAEWRIFFASWFGCVAAVSLLAIATFASIAFLILPIAAIVGITVMGCCALAGGLGAVDASMSANAAYGRHSQTFDSFKDLYYLTIIDTDLFLVPEEELSSARDMSML